MNDVFAITQVGLQQGQERLNTISVNAAHATVPGYRRQVVATQVTASPTFAAHLAAPGGTDPARGRVQGVDLRPAQFMSTGKPLDLAIEGASGFFALSDGERTYLTRDGSFRVDPNGYLIAHNGMRVQGSQGDIQLPSGDVEVSGNGQIMHAGQVVATLQLFKPERAATVTALAGALLSAGGPLIPVQDGEVTLRTAHLEASNAGGPQDMLSLMAVTRQFESLVRITQGYDEVLGRAIQKLGEV